MLIKCLKRPILRRKFEWVSTEIELALLKGHKTCGGKKARGHLRKNVTERFEQFPVVIKQNLGFVDIQQRTNDITRLPAPEISHIFLCSSKNSKRNSTFQILFGFHCAHYATSIAGSHQSLKNIRRHQFRSLHDSKICCFWWPSRFA